MSAARIHLFDTTLRDGAQTTGVDFSLDDKRAVAAMLDKLGIDYVEGGYPGANPPIRNSSRRNRRRRPNSPPSA
jgi:2-isopropylmalate synthase